MLVAPENILRFFFEEICKMGGYLLVLKEYRLYFDLEAGYEKRVCSYWIGSIWS